MANISRWHTYHTYVIYAIKLCNINNKYIWAIPRKVTYTLQKKSQLVGQSIKEGEPLNNESKYKQVQTVLQVLQKNFTISLKVFWKYF